MFEFNLRSAPARRPSVNIRACLRFETLEERVVANAAPSIGAFYVTQHLNNKQVVVTGTVTDECPMMTQITFSGVASGTVMANSQGQFTATLTCSGTGPIQAVAKDMHGLTSEPAQLMVTNSAPVIQNFVGIQGTNNTWTFTGQVADEAPTGLYVIITGLPSLVSQYAVVNANGQFSLTVQLNDPLDFGTVSANCTDWYGAAARSVYTYITPL